MSITVCIAAKTLDYPAGGSHMWVYLNWALGFKAAGCEVIWLEEVDQSISVPEIKSLIKLLKEKLHRFGFENLALCAGNGNDNFLRDFTDCFDVNTAAQRADIFINQWYGISDSILKKFRKTVFLDIDPGLTQLWMSNKYLDASSHDLYFTIGETVGLPHSNFPDLGLEWNYTPPCVSLHNWPVVTTSPGAPLTTVTHWSMDEWENDNEGLYSNDKRTGFLPYFDLPKYSPIPLELAALFGDGEEEERRSLQKNGWQIKDSHSVASTPQGYQSYIQNSAGEFSCVKPSCIRLQNAWISDRTLCYLASGKPAVVQHTGPSKFLPDNAGLLRFKDFNGAIQCLEEVSANYDKHCALARELCEEYFDAKKVTMSLLERALN